MGTQRAYYTLPWLHSESLARNIFLWDFYSNPWVQCITIHLISCQALPQPQMWTSPQPLVLDMPYHPLISTVWGACHFPNCSLQELLSTFSTLFSRNLYPLLTNSPIASSSPLIAPFAYLSYQISDIPMNQILPLFHYPGSAAHFPTFLYCRTSSWVYVSRGLPNNYSSILQ